MKKIIQLTLILAFLRKHATNIKHIIYSNIFSFLANSASPVADRDMPEPRGCDGKLAKLPFSLIKWNVHQHIFKYL